MGSECWIGTEFQFCKRKRVLGMDSVWLYNVSVLNILNCTFKNVLEGLCIFYHNFKKLNKIKIKPINQYLAQSNWSINFSSNTNSILIIIFYFCILKMRFKKILENPHLSTTPVFSTILYYHTNFACISNAFNEASFLKLYPSGKAKKAQPGADT